MLTLPWDTDILFHDLRLETRWGGVGGGWGGGVGGEFEKHPLHYMPPSLSGNLMQSLSYI